SVAVWCKRSRDKNFERRYGSEKHRVSTTDVVSYGKHNPVGQRVFVKVNRAALGTGLLIAKIPKEGRIDGPGIVGKFEIVIVFIDIVVIWFLVAGSYIYPFFGAHTAGIFDN